jgi:hypothetical protein
MKDKIIQVSGFGVENTQSTQCNYMIVGLTESGKVLITQGDRKWADISPYASQPTVPANGADAMCCLKTDGTCNSTDCDGCIDYVPPRT